jgi:hypothetical protein
MDYPPILTATEICRRKIGVDITHKITKHVAIRVAVEKERLLAAHILGSQTCAGDWEVRANDIVMIDSSTGRMDVRFYARYKGTQHWSCFGTINLIPSKPPHVCPFGAPCDDPDCNG